MQLTINGGTVPADSRLGNWGELLDCLEHGDGRDRMVVTAVRFGGVDEPSFRDAAVLARSLGDAEGVDVETATVIELIGASAAAVRAELPPVLECTIATARAFRRHDVAAASRQLVGLLDTFRTITTLVDSIGIARRSMPETAAAADGHGQDATERVRVAFEALVDAQNRQDWIDVADVLEYEVADAVGRWMETI